MDNKLRAIYVLSKYCFENCKPIYAENASIQFDCITDESLNAMVTFTDESGKKRYRKLENGVCEIPDDLEGLIDISVVYKGENGKVYTNACEPIQSILGKDGKAFAFVPGKDRSTDIIMRIAYLEDKISDLCEKFEKIKNHIEEKNYDFV